MECNKIPFEVWTNVFTNLNVNDIAKISCVCVVWRNAACSYRLWKNFYTFTYGHPDALYNVEMIPEDPPYWRDKFFERHNIEEGWVMHRYQKIIWTTPDKMRVGTQQFSQKEGVYVTGSTGGKVFLYDLNLLQQGKPPMHLISFKGHKDAVRGIQFDANKIVSASRDGTVRVWDKRLEVVTEARNRQKPPMVIESKSTISCGEHCNSIMFQGNTLIAGFSNGDLRQIDLETSQTIQNVCGHNRWIRHIQFTGDRIVSGGADGKILLWDVRDMSQPVRQFLGHEDCVTAVQFHEDRAVSGSYDKTVRVWSMSSGTCETLSYHIAAVRSLQYDWNKIITGSGNNSVTIYGWNTKNHCELFRTYGFVSSVRFSRNLLSISSSDARITMLQFVTKKEELTWSDNNLDVIQKFDYLF